MDILNILYFIFLMLLCLFVMFFGLEATSQLAIKINNWLIDKKQK